MSKIITRFSKRANEGIKVYIDRVQKNAAAASSVRKSISVPYITSDTGTVTTIEPKDIGQHGRTNVKSKAISVHDKAVGGTSAGMKRALSGTTSGKRTLPAGNVSARAVSTPTIKSTGNVTSEKNSGGGNPMNTSSSASVAKLKGNQVVAKPTNFFSSLQPALKKNTTGYNNNAGTPAEVRQKIGSARFVYIAFKSLQNFCK